MNAPAPAERPDETNTTRPISTGTPILYLQKRPQLYLVRLHSFYSQNSIVRAGRQLLGFRPWASQFSFWAMDTFEGLSFEACGDTVAKLGCVWRMLPVGTGRRLSHGRVVSSATTVRVRLPPQSPRPIVMST